MSSERIEPSPNWSTKDFENLYEGPDLLALLAESSKLPKLKLQIPVTLIKKRTPVLLYTNACGIVTKKYSSNVLSRFFSLAKAKGTIKFVFNSRIACKNMKEALKYWNNSKEETAILQEFIVSPQNTLKKLRVHWKLGHANSYVEYRKELYQETLTQQLPELKRKISKSMNKVSLADYKHAGRLLRSSFSPDLPYKSSLQPKRTSSIQSRPSNSFKSSEFILKSDEAVPVSIPGAPKIDQRMNNILSALAHLQEDSDKTSYSELVVDFLGNSTFLKCKAHLKEYICRRESLSRMASSCSEQSCTTAEASTVISGNVFNLQTRLATLQLRQQSFKDMRKRLNLDNAPRELGCSTKFERNSSYQHCTVKLFLCSLIRHALFDSSFSHSYNELESTLSALRNFKSNERIHEFFVNSLSPSLVEKLIDLTIDERITCSFSHEFIQDAKMSLLSVKHY